MNVTTASHINDMSIDMLRYILSKCIMPPVLQTCHYWEDIILGNTSRKIQGIPRDILQQEVCKMAQMATGPTDVRQIPASMYDLLTLECKIMIPNKLIAGTDCIIAKGYKYPIEWMKLIKLMPSLLPKYMYYDEDLRSLQVDIICRMFATYEQYRRLVIRRCGLILEQSHTYRRLKANSFEGVNPSKFAKTLLIYFRYGSTIHYLSDAAIEYIYNPNAMLLLDDGPNPEYI